MRRGSKRDDAPPSYDSFLDIVANLVGILVILITVIGVRAQDAWQDTDLAKEAKPAVPSPLPNVDGAREETARLSSEVDSLQRLQSELAQKIELKGSHRDDLVQAITSQKEEISETQVKLDQEKNSRQQLASMVDTAHGSLKLIQSQLFSIDKEVNSPKVIEHHPTPLAKTVFGREIHFRLLGKRLAYVPLEELTALLKREAEHKIWKLKNAPRITETIGPRDGFQLQYTLIRRTVIEPTQAGNMVRQRVELDRFIMVPTSASMGQELNQALQPNSEFAQRLSQLNPDITTITVWTYPDSFDDFRRLKHHLRRQGFLAAARPLPHGHPIGGSPNGSRSMAQ